MKGGRGGGAGGGGPEEQRNGGGAGMQGVCGWAREWPFSCAAGQRGGI